jgi:hypothetical protein
MALEGGMRVATIAVLTMLLAGGAAFGQSSQQGTRTRTTPGDALAMPTSPAAHDPVVNPSAAGTQMGWRGYGATSETARHGASALPQADHLLTAPQVRERLQQLGYSRITALQPGQAGWKAAARRGDRRVRVDVDPHGNLVGER